MVESDEAERTLEESGERRWRGMGEVGERVGIMRMWALREEKS